MDAGEAAVSTDGEHARVGSLLSDIGAQVRAMRKAQHLTIEQLSVASGISVGIISQVERGKANPAFSTLAQLAHGLNVPVGRLFHVAPHGSPVVRKHERRELGSHGVDSDDGGRYQLLTPDLNGALEVTWLETHPGYDTSSTPYRHNGEEFGLVIAGAVDVYIEGEKHHLEEGDSIRYSSTIPHWYVNPGPGVCQAIWVITPPTW